MSFPPVKPKNPIIVPPLDLTHSAAFNIFGEFPLADMAKTMSFFCRKGFSCSQKTESYPRSLDKAVNMDVFVVRLIALGRSWFVLFLPQLKSVAKCAEVAALPPFPMQKIF